MKRNPMLPLLAVAVLLTAGCAAALPPHVWMPLDNVRYVDVFWWTDTGQCQMRLIRVYGQDDYRGETFDVPAQVCLDHLKADGYKVKHP